MKNYFLLFDLGGVVEDHHFHKFADFIEKKYGVKSKRFYDILIKNLRLADKCVIEDKELIPTINKETGLKLTEEKFYKYYFSFVHPNYKMTDLLEKLAGTYRLALLSNTRQKHIMESERRCDYKSVFDFIFISQNFCIRKPEINYYKIVLNNIKTKPKECIFIDDKERNLITARRLGINCILYDGSITDLKKKLKKYGVIVPKKRIKGICKAHIHKISL